MGVVICRVPPAAAFSEGRRDAAASRVQPSIHATLAVLLASSHRL